MKTLLSLTLLSVCSFALATPPELRALTIANVADTVSVDGVISSAFAIQSTSAQYTLVLSRTGQFSSGAADSDERSARLYATLFVDTADGLAQQWRIQDAVDACPVDLTADFTNPAVVVSDADSDGTAEIWVSYRLACRGDVSPSTLKVIGYQGSQKYALRGTSRIMLGEDSEGGSFEADAALTKAPKLLEQARSVWMKVRDEGF